MAKATDSHITRRNVLAAAAVAVPAAGVLTAADTRLRQLWSEYVARVAAYEVADRKYKLAREAFDAEHPPCPDDVLPGDHWRASSGLWQKHGLEELSEAWNATAVAVSNAVAEILTAPAEGFFGIGAKLSALPTCPDEEDYEAAMNAALEDIERILGVSVFPAISVA
jgi:hypothetical protein